MTTDDTAPVDHQPGLAHAFRTMPKWKILLLTISLVVGVLGVGAQVASRNLHRDQPQVVVTHTTAAPSSGVPGGGSGFVGGGQPSGADQPQTTTTTTATGASGSTLTDWLSPAVTAVGFSFFAGLIAGVITRAFLKIATLLAGLVVAVIGAAHYFNINLDLSHVQAETGQATTWMQGQLMDLWGVVRQHLPSAGSATAGFLFGMKRR
jgi:uncharacterized membrane protein (Fun14 family)